MSKVKDATIFLIKCVKKQRVAKNLIKTNEFSKNRIHRELFTDYFFIKQPSNGRARGNSQKFI